ncbi:RHS repeat-associated core domain-containing protein [Pseudomonas viridiflava]|uniref:RHS repeat-associated core domain-containing protein n=1 Tax=Pseudomonas viridiflava TaxID=33069 RepID=UPI002A6A97BA|nr:RHS repeat-associated core domain-containing protein [Pseudomonas viridiflava]MDY0938440.1 RHS repeat-associated core domain-containing protein [Pseudomonas viridiflava]MDY1015450.1 RHS repeat-associated core domain-containing protein [Pseudomonas viridiflava]
MSGLPVSHVGEKVSGGVIATGSPTVHVGSSGVGMADRVSACVPNVGQPVNPMLGCKLLPEEVDFALAAPDTLSFGRGYLSSNPRIGKLGQGWWLPGESMVLELDADTCVLIDAQGRRITFPALTPGKELYSGSEQLWLRRGGIQSEAQSLPAWKGRWAAVPTELQCHEGAVVLLADSSYLCFMQQPDGIWRLHLTFGRNGYRTEFGWSRRGFLTSIRDSAGRSYVLVYQHACDPRPGDDGIRLCGVILANLDGPVPEHFDPQTYGHDWLVRYQFNEAGDLIAVRDRAGEIVRVFAWNNHIMIAHGEPGGQEVRYAWDVHGPEGRVIKQSEADGLVREFRYNADATDVVDNLGRVERYEFSGEAGQRRWTALVRADGSRTEFEYDLFGRLVLMRDPLGRETRRRLDGQGRLLEELSPGKRRYCKTLDEETGQLKALLDTMGRQWTFTRDERGNMVSVVAPNGTTRYHYDDPALPDRPTRIIDSKGGVKTLQWNRLGLPVSVTDCSSQTRRYEYDGEGRVIAETDPTGQVSRTQYDLLGQVIGLSFADGASFVYRYDAQGRQTHMTDNQGHCTQFFWDRNGRLLRASDAAGYELRYLYDEAGRLCSTTNQNGVQARFTYDMLDRLIEEIGFDGRRQQYRYNLADELIMRIDADQGETHYRHDLDGRLLSTTYPATQGAAAFIEQYDWMPDGRLAAVRNSECEVRFVYDEAGNLCLENQVHADGWVYAVEHQHDSLGVRESSRYGDAPVVNWLTYGSGHLHGVVAAHVEIGFERDALHRERCRDARLKGGQDTLFNLQREYDPTGRLVQSHLKLAATEAWKRAYRYDRLGQLMQVVDNQHPDLRYAYDLSGAMVASQRGNAPERRYRFDPAGNRLDTDDEESAQRQTYYEHNELYRSGYTGSSHDATQLNLAAQRWAGNRIETFRGSTYRYDAVGNLTERTDPDGSRLRLTYDGAQRLVRLKRQRPDGIRVEANYRYDALSRRIAKTVRVGEALSLVRYGWDGGRQCAEAFDGMLRTTVHEPDSFVPLLRLEQHCEPDSPDLLAVRKDMAAAGEPLPAQCRPELGEPIFSFFHTDHIGTPLQLSDEHGRVTWQARPDDWRAVAHEQGSTDQPIRFQGQYHDEESGLYYNHHRYYLPDIGRYASQDPVGFRSGPNAYSYALNIPTIAYDPSGLFVPLVFLGGLLLKAAIGATIDASLQAGPQILGQIKDNWDEGHFLLDIKWRCIDIDMGSIGVSAAAGAVAPSMIAGGKSVYKSAKALKTLSGQAANTANRAAKLAARKAAHKDTIKSIVATQAGWQAAKAVGKCVFQQPEKECE